MATLKLDLSNLSVIDNKFYVIDENKTSLKYAGYKAEDVSATKVTFADGSTLEIGSDNKLTFNAASGTGTFVMDLPVAVEAQAIVDLAKVANTIAT